MYHTDFCAELVKIVDNIDDIKFAEVKQFAAGLEERKKTALEALQKEIATINEYSKKFLNAAVNLKIKSTETVVYKTLGNVNFACPLINEPEDARAYPHRPCCIKEVPDWYFIAFPELGQVLPVSNVESILRLLKDSKYTKLDENMFTRTLYESMQNSNFAVFPYTAQCWKNLRLSEKKTWPKIMHQLRIGKITDKHSFPINSTQFMHEAILKIKPIDMNLQWALFVQLYFILYLFRQDAGPEHFSI